MTEAQLCAAAVEWLQSEGWDVHQEVWGIDILAVSPHSQRLWAIEAKLGFGFGVLEQAIERRAHVHWSSVLVPKPVHLLGVRVAALYGIGIIHAEGSYLPPFTIQLRAQAALGRSAEWVSPFSDQTPADAQRRRALSIRALRGSLCEDTRTYAKAGHPSPSPWTYFKAMKREVPRILKREGPLTVRALYEKLGRHERTSTLGGFYGCLRSGTVFPGVRIVEGKRPVKYGFIEAAAEGAIA